MADYISRDKAIETVISYEFENCPDYMRDFATKLKSAVCSDIRTDLQAIPPADVRPVVRGRWEDETGFVFNDLAQRVYCPNCKSYAYFYPITMKNYCPNCGADMREVKADG